MASVALGTKAIGSTVKLKVNGTLRDFIVVHKGKPGSIYDASCDGVWLLTKDCYEAKRWHSSNVNDYANSEVHSYLNSTFLNLFDADIRAQIKQVKLPYRAGSGYGKTVTSGASGLSTKIFLLSSTEVNLVHGYEPTNEGACLSYFSGTVQNGADTKRVANYNGSAVGWWLRSPYCDSSNGATHALDVLSSGDWYSNSCSHAGRCLRPALVLPSNLLTSDDGTVNTNTAPTTPGSITVPEGAEGGKNIEVTWTASSDAEKNLEGYIVERSTDGGNTWTQVFKGGGLKATFLVPAGSETIMCRVKAYDSEGLYSGYRNSAQVSVFNNHAPGAPASITVPENVLGGGTLAVTWEAATDADNNLSGYELERQVDGGDWAQVYKGAGTSYTDTITRGWQSVNYRVRAYDTYNAYSAYTTGTAQPVNNNRPPVVSCDTPTGSDLGTRAAGFSIGYSVTDPDGDPVTVTEDIDGTALRTFSAESGKAYTMELAGETFMKLLNGSHALAITAGDGNATAVHRLSFTKEVTEASITLKEAFPADDKISICVLSVAGHIPADADYTVEVTNNANDDDPVWEDCTIEVKNGGNHIFTNETAENGFAFNFRVKVKRGPSGEGGYISGIQGGFQ
ncbi:DUF6273 domain-containing protein [uncultured Oscillibacter sp.]|uniref:DUF6273 domain-containing protein n=1 Tax=uncultured Oscillibacter sp. TaxID=876091 RepID=UPI00272A5E98|nr:DUF6273 domain-containing protein [uncultured Oscillibacter sp.]